MNPALNSKSQNKTPFVLFTLFAVILILLLFYIDEGNYHFEGFKAPLHWLIFLVYLIPTIITQVMIYRLLNKVNLQSGKLLISIVCGLLFGITGVIYAVFLF